MGTGVGGYEECKYLHNWDNLITTDETKAGRTWLQLGGKAQLSGSGRAWQMPSHCLGCGIHPHTSQHLPEAAAQIPGVRT